MKADYDAIVIGSGLGGLTAGALFATAGHEVLVLERNDSFGGAATTYHRGDLTIEASLHDTADPRTAPDPKGEIFEALDLYRDVEFVPLDAFYEVRSPLVGDPLTVPHDLGELAERLADRFPSEREAVHGFVGQLRRVRAAIAIFMKHHGGPWWLADGPELPVRLWPVLRDLRSTLSDVMERRFGDHEALKIALAANMLYYSDDPDRLWWLFFALAQGGFVSGGGNYLKGGSQTLSDSLVDRIRKAGGEALTERTVTGIVLGDQGRVAGVRYREAPGVEESTVRAPVIFANAAPHAVETMLPEAEREGFMAPYRDAPLSISLFSITLGLDRAAAELGLTSYSTILVPAWVERLADFKRSADLLADPPGERMPLLGIVDYGHVDSGLGDGSLFPVNVIGPDRLSSWEGLDEDAYQAKKDAWLDAVVRHLDEEWPGLAAAVVQREMATARTMREHLNTPGGALFGFAPEVPVGQARRGPSTSVPGLWLASAWSAGGGFTGAMSGGAMAAKDALRDLG